jgi:hypothetical protein
LFHVVPDVVVQLKQGNRRDVAPLLVELFRRTRDSFDLFEGGLEAMEAGALDAEERHAFITALGRRVDQAHEALIGLQQAMEDNGLVWMDEDLGLLVSRASEHLARGGLAIDDESSGVYGDASAMGGGLATAVSRARDIRTDRQLARRALLERVRMDDLIG